MNKAKNREVYILIILLLIFAVYGFYTLLLSPKMTETGELANQVESEDAIVRSMYATILKYDTDAAELQEKQNQTRMLTKHYYVQENQETFLDDLKRMLADCGVSYVKIESEYPTIPVLIDEENYNYESPYLPYIDDLSTMRNLDGTINISQVLQKVEELSGEIPDIDQMQITVEATGAYSSIYKLIEKLEMSEKQILCNVMELDVVSDSAVAREADPQVKVTMQLQFVRLVEMDCLRSEEFPQMSTDFTMPDDFVTGKYRSFFLFGS
jgi:hypothetical protein